MEILITNSDFVLADSGSKSGSGALNLPETWQFHVKNAVRSLPDLLQRLELNGAEPEFDAASGPFIESPSESPSKSLATVDGLIDGPNIANPSSIHSFPVFVPLPFLSRIRKGDPRDPLLLQVLPSPREDDVVAGFTTDPLMEAEATQSPGLLQKYAGRVLLVATGVCAIHCRYCFRRHFPYEDSPKSLLQWSESLRQIKEDDSIREVILSGGDPLMLVDERLEQLINAINEIPHVKRLRIHTRMPIMIPQRVNERLLTLLKQSRLTAIMVIHANHANELDESVAAALGRLADAGVMLLNQSVLLRGINDNVETLVPLSERLVECRVMPYYLHKNDQVAGTAHFEVSIERGRELIEQMRARLPGYAVPRFVQEIPGELSKTLLT